MGNRHEWFAGLAVEADGTEIHLCGEERTFERRVAASVTEIRAEHGLITGNTNQFIAAGIDQSDLLEHPFVRQQAVEQHFLLLPRVVQEMCDHCEVFQVVNPAPDRRLDLAPDAGCNLMLERDALLLQAPRRVATCQQGEQQKGNHGQSEHDEHESRPEALRHGPSLDGGVGSNGHRQLPLMTMSACLRTSSVTSRPISLAATRLMARKDSVFCTGTEPGSVPLRICTAIEAACAPAS